MLRQQLFLQKKLRQQPFLQTNAIRPLNRQQQHAALANTVKAMQLRLQKKGDKLFTSIIAQIVSQILRLKDNSMHMSVIAMCHTSVYSAAVISTAI